LCVVTGDVTVDRRLRHRRSLDVVGVGDPPAGVVPSMTWYLDGAGVVAAGILPGAHPCGAPSGKRVLWGDGVWAADLSPSSGRLCGEWSFIVPTRDAPAARLVVHSPDEDVVGSVDQPGLPERRVERWTTGLRRDARQIRIRVADRTWWVRAINIFGVRVLREHGGEIFATRGLRSGFVSAADELDVSVVLLTLASVPSSSYAPVLGF
jgi:hypothetical protein